MQELILLVGNIGCGKSFLASRLAKRGAIVINNDSLLKMFHGGEYTYDSGLRDFYRDAEDELIKIAIDSGRSIVVDRTNINVKARARFIDTAKTNGLKVISFDFGPGQDSQLQRRIDDPQGQTADTWTSVYRSTQLRYEEPSSDEGIDCLYKAPTEFKFWGFDFDGTICEHRFPYIGSPIQSTINKLNELSKDLTNVIIIWSCRSGDLENQMKDWLDDNGVYYDFINENPIFNIGTRKIFCHAYIDDRAAWIHDNEIKKCVDSPVECISYDESKKEVESILRQSKKDNMSRCTEN